MSIRLAVLITIALLLSSNQQAWAGRSQLVDGYLVIPRVDVEGYDGFELVMQLEFSGEFLFVVQAAFDAESDVESSGFYDQISQTLVIDEIEVDTGQLYSASLELVSVTPSIVFRLADAQLIGTTMPGDPDPGTDPDPGSDPNPDADPDPVDIQTLMQLPELNCANSACHDATPGTARVNLHTGSVDDFVARLVDQPSGSPSCSEEKLIDSSNPANSLLLKLIDSDAETQCISKMPLGQSGVAAEHYAEFAAWVDELIAASEAQDPAPEPDEEPAEPIPALDGFSALKRIKYILHGGAVTDADFNNALDDNGDIDPEGLEQTIESWFDTDPFERKMLSFLGAALQQSHLGPIVPEYFTQLGVTWGQDICEPRPDGLYSHDAMELTLTEIIPRTAYRLIASDGDFRDIASTNEIVSNSIGLFALSLGDQSNVANNMNLCEFPGLALSDFHDWRMVRILPSDSPADFQEQSANFVEQMRSIPEGGSLSLRANRNGICNSFSFLANWPTNVSNQFRLNASQCMIAALGLTFEAGDSTPPNSLIGIDSDHVDPDTDCYGCHQHLDPMTNAFKGQYKLNHSLLDSLMADNDSDFAFHGHSSRVSTMQDLNDALSTHPYFGMGIALKLCQWATSQVCSADDPVMQGVAQDFADSDYRFKQLILSLFTSPLLTTESRSGGFAELGTKVSATRAQHMCLSLETRMEQQLATDRVENLEPDPKVCYSGYYRNKAREVLPEDLFQRGYPEFIQASSINLITPKLHEPLCDEIRDPVLQAFEGYNSSRTDQTLDNFTRFIVGVPDASPDFDNARQALGDLYDLGRAPRCSSIDALSDSLEGNQSCGFGLNHRKSMELVFRNICLAPNTTAIGL